METRSKAEAGLLRFLLQTSKGTPLADYHLLLFDEHGRTIYGAPIHMHTVSVAHPAFNNIPFRLFH